MQLLVYLIVLLGSLALGFIIGIWFAKKNLALTLKYTESQLNELRAKEDKLQREISELHCRNGELSATNESLKRETLLKENILLETKNQLNEKFENVAHKLFESSSDRLVHLNKETINSLLAPLRQQMEGFEKQVRIAYDQEGKERASLKTEIQSLMRMNQQMSQETVNLTRALKGDVKVQGNWGEIMIERILEKSGLREDDEFIREGKSFSLKDHRGGAQRPDVLILLPDKKQIIVDCKVSLLSYQRFIEAETEDDKKLQQKELIASIQKHIKELAEKKYQYNDSLCTPEFVLLFMPIEGALSIALQEKEDLFQSAWDQNIVLVTPTTLLATLRTVASIWKQERQTKNALAIAQKAGGIYDKFVNFLEDFEDVGRKVEGAAKSFDEARRKLTTGRGNIVEGLQDLVDMGAKSKKKIPEQFLLKDSPDDSQ